MYQTNGWYSGVNVYQTNGWYSGVKTAVLKIKAFQKDKKIIKSGKSENLKIRKSKKSKNGGRIVWITLFDG